jgi:hypothetical protein
MNSLTRGRSWKSRTPKNSMFPGKIASRRKPAAKRRPCMRRIQPQFLSHRRQGYLRRMRPDSFSPLRVFLSCSKSIFVADMFRVFPVVLVPMRRLVSLNVFSLNQRIGREGAVRPHFRFPESCSAGRTLLIGRS